MIAVRMDSELMEEDIRTEGTPRGHAPVRGRRAGARRCKRPRSGNGSDESTETSAATEASAAARSTATTTAAATVTTNSNDESLVNRLRKLTAGQQEVLFNASVELRDALELTLSQWEDDQRRVIQASSTQLRASCTCRRVIIIHCI